MPYILEIKDVEKIAALLNNGKVGVIPTDTIYGIHCRTNDTLAIERIYEIKHRPENMPMITLISSIKDFEPFGIEVGDFESEQIEQFWPGPNTLIFNTLLGNSKSFRLPKDKFLTSLLELTGPLISTSANPHGKPSAKNIQEAIEYFADGVDFYVDGGDLDNPPSNVYKVSGGELVKLR